MKKLERMNGELFESLKENEMTQISSLVGGYYTTSTNNGGDTTYHYETWSATNGDSGANKDGLHEDSQITKENHVVSTNEPEQPAFLITESHPDE